MMTQTRRRALQILAGLCFVAILATAVCWADDAITIDVAPNVLNLQNQGQVVTIHTDIDYNLVAGSSVTLNDIEIASWKADDRGDFVAKFLMDEVKDLPLNIGQYNTLMLRGETRTGQPFSGSQDILVINNIPAGKK